MEFDERGFALLDLPDPAPALLDSFHHLQFDKYAGLSRYRRFGQYRLTPAAAGFTVERLPSRPYVAPREFNRLVGGIARDYAPLTADFTGYLHWAAPTGTALVRLHRRLRPAPGHRRRTADATGLTLFATVRRADELE